MRVIDGDSSGSKNLTIVGLLDELNKLLKESLVYTPPQDYYGPDYLSVFAYDEPYGRDGKSSNETIPIFVHNVNDPPVMRVLLRSDVTQGYEAPRLLSVLEDHRLALVGINITDPDFIEIAQTNPTYSRDTNSFYEGIYPKAKAFDSWNVSNYREQQAGLLRLHVKVAHGSIMFASTAGINILTVPNATAETERLSDYPNIVTTFSNRNLYAGVNGPVFEEGQPSVDASTPIGSGTTSGTTQQIWWREVLIEGRLFDLNRALAVVTYWPDLNWNSGGNTPTSKINCEARQKDQMLNVSESAAGSITCTRSFAEFDHLNFTVQSAIDASLPPSTGSIFVKVLAVNDAPVLHFPHDAMYSRTLLTEDMLFAQVQDLATQYTVEDTPIDLTDISVFDVDAPMDAFVSVNLTAVHGAVSISHLNQVLEHSLSAEKGNVGLHFEVGTGNMDPTLIFTGPISAVNIALRRVTFHPELNHYGVTARLVVSVNDLGNFGEEGLGHVEKTDSKTYRIVVQPANDVADILMPGDSVGPSLFTMDEGTILHILGAINQPLVGVIDPKLLAAIESQGFDNTSSSSIHSGVIVNTTNAFQSGFELWRFIEPRVYSTHGEFGAGRLEWDVRQVADMHPGPGSSNPRYFANYKGMIYFQASDGEHGAELWRDFGVLQTETTPNDGSSDGDATTQLFMDIMPGGRGGNPSFLTVHEDFLYFAADGVDTSWMVLPAHRDACGSFRKSTFDSRVSFAVSQSTTWLPQRSYDCPVGYHWASTAEAYRYFTSYLDGTLQRFWHSEYNSELGERHGPQEYTEVYQWERSTSLSSPVGLHGHEAKVYQEECGWDGLFWGEQKRTHFRFSDSHITGAFKHAGKPDSYRPDIDASLRSSAGVDVPLWTEEFAGIVCILGAAPADIPAPGTNISRAEAAAQISQGLGTEAQGVGMELWRTDGTVEGTERLDDVYIGTQSSNPEYLTSFGPYLYFAATNAPEGRELWRTEGRAIGQAEMVSAKHTAAVGIYPGPTGSNPADLTVAGNYMFFAATDPYRGREVWYLQFEKALSERVLNPGVLTHIDIVEGIASSNPKWFESSGGRAAGHVPSQYPRARC